MTTVAAISHDEPHAWLLGIRAEYEMKRFEYGVMVQLQPATLCGVEIKVKYCLHTIWINDFSLAVPALR